VTELDVLDVRGPAVRPRRAAAAELPALLAGDELGRDRLAGTGS
jgi:hypothetical protein